MNCFQKKIEKLKINFWISNPFIVLKFYQIKWKFYKRIVIITHGGLGDLAIIVPALKRMAPKYKEIFIVCNKEFFETIRILFQLPQNIENIHFEELDRKKWVLSPGFLKLLKKKGKLIYLGFFANDPIVKYPNSFYIKLGISTKYVTEKYEFKVLKHLNFPLLEFQKKIGNSYTYINLSTSEINTPFNNPINKDDICVSYGNSAQELGFTNYFNVNEVISYSVHQSIINKVILCLSAKNAIVSDAGLFNIVFKFFS